MRRAAALVPRRPRLPLGQGAASGGAWALRGAGAMRARRSRPRACVNLTCRRAARPHSPAVACCARIRQRARRAGKGWQRRVARGEARAACVEGRAALWRGTRGGEPCCATPDRSNGHALALLRHARRVEWARTGLAAPRPTGRVGANCTYGGALRGALWRGAAPRPGGGERRGRRSCAPHAARCAPRA
eukprot:7381190-Prymnesium_polylepis.2